MTTIRTTGLIDEKHQLRLDEPLPVTGPSRVRVIILMPESSEIDEKDWLKTAAANPCFDFLKDPKEDIYTLADGKEFGE